MKTVRTLAVGAVALFALFAIEMPTALAQDPLQQQILAKEREGLDALKAGNVEHFATLTASEAVFVDAHGMADKATVMNNVVAFHLTDYSIDDVHFIPVAAKTGLISYALTEKGTSHEHEFTAHVYVSSVWTERDGKWVCLFSQETSARTKP